MKNGKDKKVIDRRLSLMKAEVKVLWSSTASRDAMVGSDLKSYCHRCGPDLDYEAVSKLIHSIQRRTVQYDDAMSKKKINPLRCPQLGINTIIINSSTIP